ncbi:MAG: hypothetical protein ABI758_05410 [Candidatus Woesebacteria bacterium]
MASKLLSSFTIGGVEISAQSVLSFARRRRFFAISALSWVIMLILAITVVVPQVQQILARRSEIALVQAEVDKNQTFINSLESLDTSDLTRANTVLSASLPQEKPVLPFLYSLNRLAAGAQVSVSDFEISPGLLGTSSGTLDNARAASTIDPQLAALPLRMNVAGGFENLSTFFKSLDFVLPLIQITSIQFASVQKTTSTTSTASGSAQYTAKVDLSSLYMKSKPVVGEETTIANLSPADTALLEKLTSSYTQREADNAQQSVEASASGRTNLFVSPQ